MIRPEFAAAPLPAAVLRLARLSPLAERDLAALVGAVTTAAPARARKELITTGTPVGGPRLIVQGWAARVRILADGRRQFLGFLLPGDLIGMCDQPRPVATCSVVAITMVSTCTPPPPEALPALADVYAISRALDEAYLLNHVVRLGRLSAHEKIADLLLEVNDRLELAGLAEGGRFAMPLTQEVLGDTLGLTSVHINRMAQQLRRDGDLVWGGGEVRLTDPRTLASRIGRQPVVVSRRGADA